MSRFIMPILSIVLIVLAFIAGRLSSSAGGGQEKGDYYAVSAELYQKAVTLDSPPADSNDLERWQKVLAAYRHVFDDYPDSPYADDALYTIASRIDIQDQPDTAFTLYRRLLNNYPDSDYAPEALNAIGVALFQREQYDRALVVFDQLVNNYPTHPLREKALLNRAVCQYKRGKYDDALKELEQFTDEYPMSTEIAAPRFYAAMIFYDKQDYENARVRFKNLVDLGDPEYAAPAQFNIGQTYFDERKYPEAIAAYRQTIQAYGESEYAQEAAFRIGWGLERQKKYAEAIAQLKGAIEKYPKSKNAVAAQLFVAEIYAAGLKDVPNAVAAFRSIVDGKIDVSAIETDTRSAYDIRRDAQYRIGKLYEDTGNLDKAAEEYRKLLKDFAEPHSVSSHKSNQIDEAYIIEMKSRHANAPK